MATMLHLLQTKKRYYGQDTLTGGEKRRFWFSVLKRDYSAQNAGQKGRGARHVQKRTCAGPIAGIDAVLYAIAKCGTVDP